MLDEFVPKINKEIDQWLANREHAISWKLRQDLERHNLPDYFIPLVGAQKFTVEDFPQINSVLLMLEEMLMITEGKPAYIMHRGVPLVVGDGLSPETA